MPDLFIEIPDSKYGDGVILEEYQGKWSLVSAQVGKDGKNYKRWTFPQGRDRQPTEKPIPLKITLGDLETAADVLAKLYRMLKPKHGGAQ